MGYRCVKCSGTHGPGKCTIPAGAEGRRDVAAADPVTGEVLMRAEFTLKCANCNVEGHSANSRDCPKRQALLAKRSEQKKKEKVPAVRTTLQRRNSTVRPGVSYAGATAGSTPQAEMSLKDVMSGCSVFNETCQEVFGKDFLTCGRRIRQYAAEFNTLSSKADKAQAVVGILSALFLNV